MAQRREYVFAIEERGKNMRVNLKATSQEMMAMDLVLIAMRALKAIAELCPGAEPKVRAALEVLELDEVYDVDSLN